MRTAPNSLQLLLLSLAGWISHHQQQAIDYLVEENRVLKGQLGDRKLRLHDDQRRRLAAKVKRIGRQALNRMATIVTPDTIMRWHRQLIALKWTSCCPETQPRRNRLRSHNLRGATMSA